MPHTHTPSLPPSLPIPPHPTSLPVQQEEERLQQELEENRGVSLHLQLSAAPADMAAAAARGIKRAADKLLLPPSAGASLLNQDASRNGAMLFEVAASNGGRTHAGVLEVRGSPKGRGGVLECDKAGHFIVGLCPGTVMQAGDWVRHRLQLGQTQASIPPQGAWNSSVPSIRKLSQRPRCRKYPLEWDCGLTVQQHYTRIY